MHRAGLGSFSLRGSRCTIHSAQCNMRDVTCALLRLHQTHFTSHQPSDSTSLFLSQYANRQLSGMYLSPKGCNRNSNAWTNIALTSSRIRARHQISHANMNILSYSHLVFRSSSPYCQFNDCRKSKKYLATDLAKPTLTPPTKKTINPTLISNSILLI